MSVALKLVHARQFNDQVEVDVESAAHKLHSLHTAFRHLSPWQPTIARYVVERFSQKGDVVLDPFCAAGATALETMLCGRVFWGATSDPNLAAIAQARISPADLPEVALRIQLLNLKRPVDVRSFQHPFPLFFDVDTFCELVNLKSVLKPSRDRVDAFLSMVIASVLHGHTAGHLSGYTSPQIALSADQQAELNRKRGEVPSYRAVVPRVLRKSAGLLRDGVPSVLARESESGVRVADPRNLSHIATGSVHLALFSPEQPGVVSYGLKSWLRGWWLNGGTAPKNNEVTAGAPWRDYANEVLVEMARVVRRGGRAVVRVGSGRSGNKLFNYKDELSTVLQDGLLTYWTVEGTIVERHVKSAGLAKGPSESSRDAAGELVVLRRK